jgi:hypothetical protein
VAEAESQLERELSRQAMSSTKPEFVRLEGSALIEQGEPGTAIYLILASFESTWTGRLSPSSAPEPWPGREGILGDGAGHGDRHRPHAGASGADPGDIFDRSDLEQVAVGHRREDGSARGS